MSSLRSLLITAAPSFIPLDPDSVSIESIILRKSDGSIVDTSLYQLNAEGITIKPAFYAYGDSALVLSYRRIPRQAILSNQSPFAEKRQSEEAKEMLLRPASARKNMSLADLKDLRYSGSFSRGIALGNRQDLSAQSGFNLQLSGWLSQDLEVLAALSDQSVPLQPDGSTQMLRDFDQVFIQLRKDSTVLTAGDYDQTRPPGYFLNYVKRNLGVNLAHARSWKPGHNWNFKTGMSLTRGQFNRYQLPVQEGNQGPYPLPGSKGERLIVLLANTERIYLDGILLTRGMEQDYIMDYNQGTITFTNKRLITKDSRIIAEYEYTELSYSRSLLTLENTIKLNRWTLQTNVYSQQDSRRGSGWQSLDEEDKQLLASAGDQPGNTLGSGVRMRDDYQDDEIRYAMLDTLVDGKLFPAILVRSTDPVLARYTARFSDVGQYKGNYIRIEADANGAVYQWIAPDPLNGQPRGRFEPVIRLVAPEKQQMITLGAQYQTYGGAEYRSEIALSSLDKNRYSSIDDRDNQGIALMTSMRQALGRDKKALLKTLVTGRYEFRQAQFREINPYRNAEFARDWNLGEQNLKDEHLAIAGLAFEHKELGALDYQFQVLTRPGLYEGFRHQENTRVHWKNWEFKSQLSWLQAKDTAFQTRFWRPRLELSKTLPGLKDLKLGVYTEHERQALQQKGTDSLATGSFNYSLYKLYADLPALESVRMRLSVQQRNDAFLSAGAFEAGTHASDWAIDGSMPTAKAGQLDWNATYRQLRIHNRDITQFENSNTYLGRINYNLSILKGALQSGTSYEIGSGQEPKVSFVYQKTLQPGTGQYTWKDLNSDSIQQINEFFIAPFQDQADYVRFSILSDDFTRTNNIHFNQSLRINPSLYWKETKGLRGFLNRWSTVSSWRLQRKTLANSAQSWNPFVSEDQDTALITTQSALRAQLYFNRNHPVYEWQLGASDLRNRYSLITGPEAQSQTNWFVMGRISLKQAWTATAEFSKGEKSYRSDFFAANNYAFRYSQIEPRLSWQPGVSFRLSASLSWKFMHGIPEEAPVKGSIFNQKLEAQWSLAQKTSFRGYLSMARVKYERSDLPALELAMLEGLRSGQNWLWGCSLEQRLSAVLQLILSYEGRKTGDIIPVHVGRAQIRALF